MVLLTVVVAGGVGCATHGGPGPPPVQSGAGGATAESTAEQAAPTKGQWVRKTQRIGRRTFVDTYHRE